VKVEDDEEERASKRGKKESPDEAAPPIAGTVASAASGGSAGSSPRHPLDELLGKIKQQPMSDRAVYVSELNCFCSTNLRLRVFSYAELLEQTSLSSTLFEILDAPEAGANVKVSSERRGVMWRARTTVSLTRCETHVTLCRALRVLRLPVWFFSINSCLDVPRLRANKASSVSQRNNSNRSIEI
jgi:hypothetical protein